MGGGILLIQNHSLSQLLGVVYPQFKWNSRSFLYQDTDIWTNQYLANYFVEYLKKQSPSDVSRVNNVFRDIQIGENVLTKSLSKTFPEHKWIANTTSSSKKSQYMLKECIEQLFNVDKNFVLLEEYKHPDIANIELDYFLPQYNIAFEYQGLQHYRNVNLFHKQESVDNSKQRDKQKIEACKAKGIALIEVPYWWDRKSESLASTIYESRPDLFKEKPKEYQFLRTHLHNKNNKNQVKIPM